VSLLLLLLLLLLVVLQLTMGTKSPDRVAYQGVPGAYSEMAARKACPACEPLPCEQFEVAFQVRAEELLPCHWPGCASVAVVLQ
jgi:hypothetical protein